MNSKVYIILVNYNGSKVTKECIESLMEVNYKNFKIILVDNCSSDDSYVRLSDLYNLNDKIIVIKTPANNGFAGGNNFGLQYAIKLGGEIFLLLNNDTEVEPDFLDQLLDGYDSKKIHTPKINYYFDKDKSWYAAGKIDFRRCVVANGKPDVEKKVSFASGCCMLFSKEVIEKIGFLDETYFMYYEDVAYSLEAELANVNIIYKPKAIVYHKVGITSGGEESKLSIYYNNRNRLYIMKKYNFGVGCYIYTYLSRIIRVLKGYIANDNNRTIIEAYKDYRHGITGKKIFK